MRRRGGRPTFRVALHRYYLNLVLVDEEDRRYFKQQEITLWRKEVPPPPKGCLLPIAPPVPLVSAPYPTLPHPTPPAVACAADYD